MSKILHLMRLAEDVARRTFRLYDSPEKIEREAQSFWSQPITKDNAQYWHLRSSEPFAQSDDHWLKIGQRHLEIFIEFAKSAGVDLHLNSMVEWGCGGGANLVAFQQHCKNIWGVDISRDALAECQNQLNRATGNCIFSPILIDVVHPFQALEKIPVNIDLFTCFYVFELLPSKEYGGNILKIAHQLLRPNGLCIVQIKYTSGLSNAPRRWAYRRAVANMTSYELQEFWELCEQTGFDPKFIKLVPNPVEVPDRNYAYYCLQKKG